MLLSGYSPALMKFILSWEMEEEVAEALDGDGNVVKPAARWILMKPCGAS